MKKTTFQTIFYLLITFFFFTCGPSANDAIKYNDTIVIAQKKVIEKEAVLIDAINETSDNIDLVYEDFKKEIDSSIVTIKKMEAFDKKTDYKDMALSFFSDYKEVAENEYKEMISYAKVPDSLYTEEIDNKVLELSKNIDDKINKSIETFIKFQDNFAAKYKFELTEDLTQEEKRK